MTDRVPPEVKREVDQYSPEERDTIEAMETVAEPALRILRPDLDKTTVGVIPMLLTAKEAHTVMGALTDRYTSGADRRAAALVVGAQVQQHSDHMAGTTNALETVLAARRAERRVLEDQVVEASLLLALMGTEGDTQPTRQYVDGELRLIGAMGPNLPSAAVAVRAKYGAYEAAQIFVDVLRTPEPGAPPLPDDVVERLKRAIADRDAAMGKRLGLDPGSTEMDVAAAEARARMSAGER